MTLDEVLDTIDVAKAEVEWNYPLNYYIALEQAADMLQQTRQILLEGEDTEIGCRVTRSRLMELFFPKN